jgi:hypothetical protein
MELKSALIHKVRKWMSPAMKYKWAFWDILLMLGVMITGSCAQSTITPVSPPAVEIKPTETPLGGEFLGQTSPNPLVRISKGALISFSSMPFIIQVIWTIQQVSTFPFMSIGRILLIRISLAATVLSSYQM